MKIEMGESLGASWLKHVKKCVLVQTNWKASPLIEFHNRKVVEALFEEAKKDFMEKGYDVFKQNASIEQIVGQTECDVMGVCFDGDKARWEALEVAFHEQGLDYGSKEETAAKVAAKMLRIGFCVFGYMNARSANIGFASPKVHKSTLALLQDAVAMVSGFFKKHGFEFKFELIVNGEFCSKILEPVIASGAQVADTGELFLRSMQLSAMFGFHVVGDKKATKSQSKSNVVNGGEPSEAIGAYAQRVLLPILKTLPVHEIANLCDKEWCKFTFGLNLPLLSKEKIVVKGHSRSYSKMIKLVDEVYYMTNDWYEKNRGPLDAWLSSHVEDLTNLK